MCIWKVEIQDRHCEVCKAWHCNDRSNGKRTWTGLAKQIRSMDIGQEIELKEKGCNSIRSQVSRYNKKLNRRYITLRIDDTIYIKRIE